MKILLSWTGLRREPHMFHAGRLTEGTHLQVLRDSPYTGQFHLHYLLSVPESLGDAEEIVRELAALGNGPQTEIKLVQLNDPTDLDAIAQALAGVLKELDHKYGLLKHEYSVLLNTGTPQMQAVWLLLASMGLFVGRLIQTCPPDLAAKSGVAPIREVRTDFERFKALFDPPEGRSANAASR